ncbi:MAG: hypothetical protein JXR91_15145 [Deltaproteobacteria bacterium]|nr:hypothetical protein [Deltaproteobacteria bacterium]
MEMQKRKILNALENPPSRFSFKYPILAFAVLILFSTTVWIFTNNSSKKETPVNQNKFVKGLVNLNPSGSLYSNCHITIDKDKGAKFLFKNATWWINGSSRLDNLDSDKVSVTLKKGSMLAVYDSFRT